MKLLIATILVFGLTSCIDSITIRGRYADYKITPHTPITVNPSK